MSAAFIFRFSDGEPFTLEKLNANFEQMLGAINAMAGQQLLTLGTPPGAVDYVPVTGGSFAGQIAAPSMVVGAPGDQQPVVTLADLASTTDPGVAKQTAAQTDAAASTVAVAAADAATQTAAYVQADVQSIATLSNELKADLTALVTDFNALVGKYNALLAAARTAGTLAP